MSEPRHLDWAGTWTWQPAKSKSKTVWVWQTCQKVLGFGSQPSPRQHGLANMSKGTSKHVKRHLDLAASQFQDNMSMANMPNPSLVSQWGKVNVVIVSEVFENQWIWIVFAMSESQYWDCFQSIRKPMNLSSLRNERKSILGLFPKYSETNEIKVVFTMSESQCWDCFQSIRRPMNLSCFRNERKLTLRCFPKVWKRLNNKD
jgi:hypothetical protein